MSDESTPRRRAQDQASDESTSHLLRDALEGTRHLIELEMALAREDLNSELSQAKKGTVLLGASAGLAVSGVTLLFVAAALALPKSWFAALLAGFVLLCLAGGLVFAGRKELPRKPLEATARRVQSDFKHLKERIV
jgi:hypothetical protein